MTAFNYMTDMMQNALNGVTTCNQRGRVVQVLGTIVKAILPTARVGDLCILKNSPSSQIWAEVVGFSSGEVLLAPLSPIKEVSARTEVIPLNTSHRIRVGPELLGRVIDGLGSPVDGKGPLQSNITYPVMSDPPDPLTRRPINKPLTMGIKSVDGFLSCGEGQRMGIFAAAGVGKSSLLAMLAKHADVDVTVVALIGERGREVREFIDDQLGPAGMAKAVVVVATSDKPVMQRVKAAHVATAVAEYFRDQNQRVLLLMDSVTRFARSLREVGLAAGEAPTRRGFPPSVFSAIPQLMERAGQSKHGSITGLYTVLVEGDDMNEPVADEMRGTLDGHIILSRKLAATNHYPAIDILESRSRVMEHIVSDRHQAGAGRIRNIIAKYNEIELLVRMGEYQRGADPAADEALDKIEAVNRLLRQGVNENISMQQTLEQMSHVLAS